MSKKKKAHPHIRCHLWYEIHFHFIQCDRSIDTASQGVFSTHTLHCHSAKHCLGGLCYSFISISLLSRSHPVVTLPKVVSKYTLKYGYWMTERHIVQAHFNITNSSVYNKVELMNILIAKSFRKNCWCVFFIVINVTNETQSPRRDARCLI